MGFFSPYYSVFYEHRSNPEVFVNIYGFDKMCYKYIYMYILQLGERIKVKQYYSIYSYNKKLILKLYNKNPKQMFVIKYTNIFKYALFKRWFVWQTCFSFGFFSSWFRIQKIFLKLFSNLFSRRFEISRGQNTRNFVQKFFLIFSRNSFTKTSLCLKKWIISFSTSSLFHERNMSFLVASGDSFSSLDDIFYCFRDAWLHFKNSFCSFLFTKTFLKTRKKFGNFMNIN